MPTRSWMPAVLGAGSALLGAIGVSLVALWVLDGGGPASGVPELIGGATLLSLAVALTAARRRMIARAALASGESSPDDASIAVESS